MSAVTEGKPCAPLNESSNGISYEPFYGKYSSTGLSRSGEETPIGELLNSPAPRRTHHQAAPPAVKPGKGKGPPAGPPGQPPVRNTGGAVAE
jgi:hypothetical protein